MRLLEKWFDVRGYLSPEFPRRNLGRAPSEEWTGGVRRATSAKYKRVCHKEKCTRIVGGPVLLRTTFITWAVKRAGLAHLGPACLARGRGLLNPSRRIAWCYNVISTVRRRPPLALDDGMSSLAPLMVSLTLCGDWWRFL
ncbi:hypothetical protein PIB30_098440 [Stylosanthes scabra]|uniref:Uncharacterized protein n=1 Tax=Stylosanthes scabra TaxID=79078 RepID=A0ABU6XY70_9FABA|nr:hypothetical protein [Stylosanthes scabra]